MSPVLFNGETVKRSVRRIVALENGGYTGWAHLGGKEVKVKKMKRKKTWTVA